MMEGEEVAAIGEQTLKALIASPSVGSSSTIVRLTSGTSGGLPLLIATGYPREAPGDMVGDEGIERVVYCSGSMSARLANALIVSHVSDGAVMQVLAVDAHDLIPSLKALLEDFRPAGLVGLSSFISRVATYISDTSAKWVVRLTFIGESLSAMSEQSFKSKFPNARQTELYIAHETAGYIGTRLCSHLPRGHFHPARGISIEIHEPDAENAGDLLVTTADIFQSMRLTHYRIGDIGRIVAGACPCGKAVTFELFGRKGIDYIKLSGAILRREEFDRVVALFPGLIGDYRVEARQSMENGTPKGQITLHI